jgi:hypothetical protein
MSRRNERRKSELLEIIGKSYGLIFSFINILETHKNSEGIDSHQSDFLQKLKEIQQYVNQSREYKNQIGQLSIQELEEYDGYLWGFINKTLNPRDGGMLTPSMWAEMNNRRLKDLFTPSFRPVGTVAAPIPENYVLVVNLWFVKTGQQIRIEQIKRVPGRPDEIIGKIDGRYEIYPATNNVRSSRAEYSDCHPQDVNDNIRSDLYYQPMKFPNGTWEIRNKRPADGDEEGDKVFISYAATLINR